jgi:hypothetical protein
MVKPRISATRIPRKRSLRAKLLVPVLQEDRYFARLMRVADRSRGLMSHDAIEKELIESRITEPTPKAHDGYLRMGVMTREQIETDLGLRPAGEPPQSIRSLRSFVEKLLAAFGGRR